LDYPHLGAVTARLAGQRGALPPWLMLPQQVRIASQTLGQLAQTGGYLGPSGDPVVLRGEPGTPECGIPDLLAPPELTDARLGRRAALLRETALPGTAESPAAASLGPLYAHAFELATSSGVRRAFDLSEEPAKLRDAYGRDSVGQGCLLARRLVERGARF